MCEHDDFDEFARRSGELTRRQFGVMALGAGFVAALPKVAHAAKTEGADVDIRTPDGVADAYFVHPASAHGLADALVHIDKHREEARRKASNARSAVQERYMEAHVLGELGELYRRTLRRA